MQSTTNNNPAIREMREKITEHHKIYIVTVNNGLQVTSKRPGVEGKNITCGIAQAFGFDLLANGLCCSEFQIIEALVETLPQIRQPNGELNIILYSFSPYEHRKIQ